MLDSQSRLRPNEPTVLAQTIDGDTIIINQSTDVYYRLDRVGSLIFSLLAHSHTIERITKALAEAFDISTKQAHGDVQRLAQQMLQEKIILPADGLPDVVGSDGIPKQDYPYESPRLSLYRMSLHTCLRPNEPEVAATVIDGEAIIINVLTGVYYSLDGLSPTPAERSRSGLTHLDRVNVAGEAGPVLGVIEVPDGDEDVCVCLPEPDSVEGRFLEAPEVLFLERSDEEDYGVVRDIHAGLGAG